MNPSDHHFLESDTVEKVAQVFKALADPTRVKILYLLSQEESSVTHIAEVLNMSQSAVSHQLAFLKNLRLVTFKRQGNVFLYTYDDEHVITLLKQAIHHIEHE
ncbi:MAG: ArsR/SmtB family transcription factor [Clostridia bacterium]